jgi:hypothetical protein
MGKMADSLPGSKHFHSPRKVAQSFCFSRKKIQASWKVKLIASPPKTVEPPRTPSTSSPREIHTL